MEEERVVGLFRRTDARRQLNMLDHSPDHDHGPSCGSSVAPGRSRLSRRRLLAAAAVGVGVYGASRLPAGADGIRISSVEGPGQALEQAERQVHPDPPLTFSLPAEGEILFPILVGEDDWCYVLDNFGDCRSGCSRLHEGVDIMADEGLTIISSSAGVITRKYEDSGRTSGAGNGWTIEDEENGVVYRYFHLLEHAEGLEEGDTVEMGQPIGSVGETGTSGAGSSLDNFHLHFEWRPNNIAQNAFGTLQRPEFVRWQGG